VRDLAPSATNNGAMGERVRRRVVVRGRVQGVWYRDSCQQVAVAERVDGWVRNRADGAVEAVLEGPPGAVERVVAWMREGPPRARVTSVDVTTEEPAGERGFRIR
jgi:acylphosphatase